MQQDLQLEMQKAQVQTRELSAMQLSELQRSLALNQMANSLVRSEMQHAVNLLTTAVLQEVETRVLQTSEDGICLCRSQGSLPIV